LNRFVDPDATREDAGSKRFVDDFDAVKVDRKATEDGSFVVFAAAAAGAIVVNLIGMIDNVVVVVVAAAAVVVEVVTVVVTVVALSAIDAGHVPVAVSESDVVSAAAAFVRDVVGAVAAVLLVAAVVERVVASVGVRGRVEPAYSEIENTAAFAGAAEHLSSGCGRHDMGPTIGINQFDLRKWK
jgi:hypothetical protein